MLLGSCFRYSESSCAVTAQTLVRLAIAKPFRIYCNMVPTRVRPQLEKLCHHKQTKTSSFPASRAGTPFHRTPFARSCRHFVVAGVAWLSSAILTLEGCHNGRLE